jgi:hypothetical protein
LKVQLGYDSQLRQETKRMGSQNITGRTDELETGQLEHNSRDRMAGTTKSEQDRAARSRQLAVVV